MLAAAQTKQLQKHEHSSELSLHGKLERICQMCSLLCKGDTVCHALNTGCLVLAPAAEEQQAK